MVEAGLGISIMPRMLLRSCTAAVKIYPIEPEEDRVVGLAVQRPTAMAPAVEQMFPTGITASTISRRLWCGSHSSLT